MDLCYWLQPGTHYSNKLAPELIWLRQHNFFVVQERCWGLHVFLWSWRVYCSPACQAGPDRFTCVTEWGWGGGFSFRGFFCSQPWHRVQLLGYMMADFLKPHDSSGRYADLCWANHLALTPPWTLKMFRGSFFHVRCFCSTALLDISTYGPLPSGH